MNNHINNTSFENLRLQYKSIADREQSFPGYGGFPIAYHRFDTKSGHALTSLMITSNGTKLRQEKLNITQHNQTGEYLIDDSTSHNIVSAMTRAGKGVRYVLPMLENLSRGSSKPSVVVHDKKGELYELTSHFFKEQGFNVRRINLESYNTDSWNQLDSVAAPAQANDSVQFDLAVSMIGNMLVPAGLNSKDPYWENAARILIEQLLKYYVLSRVYPFSFKRYAFETGTTKMPNMASFIGFVLEQLNYYSEWVGEEHDEKWLSPMVFYFNPVIYYLKDIEKFGNNTFLSNQMIQSEKLFLATAGKAERTFSSIVSVLTSSLSPWSSSVIGNVTKDSTLNLQSFVDEPTIIYIQPSIQTTTYDNFVTALINQIYTSVLVSRRTQPDVRRVHFILDEVDGLPLIDGLANMLAYGTGFETLFTLVIQNIEQLESRYPGT